MTTAHIHLQLHDGSRIDLTLDAPHPDEDRPWRRTDDDILPDPAPPAVPAGPKLVSRCPDCGRFYSGEAPDHRCPGS